MSSGSFGKGEESSSSQNRVQIPEFLQPLLNNSVRTATRAQHGIEDRIMGALNTGHSLVAGFTPDQQAAFAQVREFSGNIPGQDTLQQAANGIGLDFLPGSVRQGLGGFGGLDFLPEFARNTLTGGASLPTRATDALGNAITADVIPGVARGTFQDALQGTGSPVATATLADIAGGRSLSPDALAGLRSTAEGDFLAGGQGFDQAVDAAVRAAQPGILSTFGSAGVGGGTGALAQTALGTAAIDAFARQFGQERQRQSAAQGTLANLGLARQQQQAGAAQALGQLGLAGQGQQLGAAESLANFGLAGQGQRIGAAESLANLGLLSNDQDLQSAGMLGDFAAGAQGRQLQGLGLLSNLSDAERSRQLTAAGALPELALSGIEPLLNIGGMQQQLAQRENTMPIDALLQLLTASLGGVPIPSLLGSNQTGNSSQMGFSLGFGDA